MTNFTTAQGVQQFSISFATGVTTATATINSVGSGAFIIYGGMNQANTSSPNKDFAYATLTNATTITATRNTTGGTMVYNGCIVDGDTVNLIKSVQYGTVTIASGAQTGTATISAVTNTNAAVHLLGWSSSNTTYSNIDENPIVTLSGTTVTAAIADAAGGGLGLVVGFVVIEFQGSALNQNVQNVAATHTGSTTAYTATISSVVSANTITFYAGSNASLPTTDFAEIMQNGRLTNATTFTVDVQTGLASNVLKYNCSVVEFVSGVLNSAVQRGTTTLTGVTSATTNLTTINETYSGVTWLNNTTTTTAADINRAYGAASLVNNVIAVFASAVYEVSGIATTSPIDTSGNASNQTSSATPTGVSLTTSQNGDFIFNILGIPANVFNTVNSPYLSVIYTEAYYIPPSTVTSSKPTYNLASSEPTSCSGAAFLSPLANAAIVQEASASSSSSTLQTTITSSVSGNIIIVGLTGRTAGATITQVADNKGQTYIQVPSAAGSYSGGFSDIWYFPNTASGVTTITATATSSQDAVTVTKNNATGNITGSWEVFEFPAYVPASVTYLIGYISDWFGI